MKKSFFISLPVLFFSFTSHAQFIIKQTDFEWFPADMKSNRCAIEAIVPRKDGTVEINTFTQTLSAVMVQTGIFAGSKGGYNYFPLMNTKRFDADLKLKSNIDDQYNFRMFLPLGDWDKKIFMLFNDRVGKDLMIIPDSNRLVDMIRKYPYAVKALGEGDTVVHVLNNDPPEDKENKFVTVFRTTHSAYDQRSNAYVETSLPARFINPIIDKRTDGKKMESMDLLLSADRSIMQRLAFFSPAGDEDKWAMYKHRIIVTFDKNGVKTNETKIDLNFARKESYISEVRNVEDNTTHGFLYVYHRVFGLGKKNLDSVMGNYEVVYLNKEGHKEFQYTFKISEKANTFNPFTCYAKDGKINCLYFGHPDGKTMAVTSVVIAPTGIENIQSMPLQEWKSLITGTGVNLSGWADDGFLLHDAVKDAKGFVYLIGEKRTDSSAPPTGTNSFPAALHIYPSHIILAIGPDGKLVRQHVVQKTAFALAVSEKTYELVKDSNGVFMVYKDIAAPGSVKPFHNVINSSLAEVQRNAEPYDYRLSVVGVKGTRTGDYFLPMHLYHSQKGVAWDAKKKNLYLIGFNPENKLPRLFCVTMW